MDIGLMFHLSRQLSIIYKIKLRRVVHRLIRQGYTHFISGMAIGIDMNFAEMVLECSAGRGRIITLECALPWVEHYGKWTEDNVNRFIAIIRNASSIYYTCEQYESNCYYRRNEYMIDNSGIVIVATDCTSLVVASALAYAIARNKESIVIKI